LYAKHHYRGLLTLRFWLLYPIYLFYRFLYQVKARNTRSAKALVQGIIDFYKGYTGIKGLRERGYIRT
jgi:hypothetical protein